MVVGHLMRARGAENCAPDGGCIELVDQGGVAWDDWLSTRYEQKALREGRVPHYLTFRRR